MQEMYRLTKDNNRMLRAMRRNAFWGGILKFFIYAALLAAPIWFYMSYLAPVVNSMLQTEQQLQGTSAKAQAQFGSLQASWQQFESKLPSFMQPATSTNHQ